MLGKLGRSRRCLPPPLCSSLAPCRRPCTVWDRIRMAPTPALMPADERSQRTIQTAACLIIGDEVLGGKTVDTNSAYMAKWCFSLGIRLKRVEVVEDDEGDIVEAVRRLSDGHDFVVTSGGIGPTHDDITYASVAKAYHLPLKLHAQAFDKMKRLSKLASSSPNFDYETDSPMLRARLRMVELPTDPERPLEKQVIFPLDDSWVPVVVVNGNIYILPGVPRLFVGLLDGLKSHVVPRLAHPEGQGMVRISISTPMSESAIAADLTELAARVGPRGVKIGSYPRWGNARNTVTLVGRDKAFLESLVAEVEEKVGGKRIMGEGENEAEASGGES